MKKILPETYTDSVHNELAKAINQLNDKVFEIQVRLAKKTLNKIKENNHLKNKHGKEEEKI